MEYFYNNFRTSKSLIDIFKDIDSNSIIVPNKNFNFVKLANMICFILSRLPLPALVIFHGSTNTIIYDNCSIYTLYSFYNNTIPVKCNLLKKEIREYYKIDSDTFFFEFSDEFSFLFRCCKITILDIYGNDKMLHQAQNLFNNI